VLGLGEFGQCRIQEVDAVRCVGNYNQDKLPAFPRMHNKFLLFGRMDGPPDSAQPSWGPTFRPQAVWTGSFNLTLNAGASLENALVIQNTDIVNAYYKEFQHILSLSEPLDWNEDWLQPEWRIGS
jgi:phosphatidylserine/phosphatidylglycerophosphate/cardiolipin synthase-like enzyme